MFGALDYFSGQLFFHGIEGRFNSDSYQAFLAGVMAEARAHLFLIHDGGTLSHQPVDPALFQGTQKADHRVPLPSYSPDYRPIEYLWKNTKQRVTHNKYFKGFAALIVSIEEALACFATPVEDACGFSPQRKKAACWPGAVRISGRW